MVDAAKAACEVQASHHAATGQPAVVLATAVQTPQLVAVQAYAVAHLNHHAAAQLLLAAVQAEAADVDNNK